MLMSLKIYYRFSFSINVSALEFNCANNLRNNIFLCIYQKKKLIDYLNERNFFLFLETYIKFIMIFGIFDNGFLIPIITQIDYRRTNQ